MSIICVFCGNSQNSSLAHTAGITYGKMTERERIIKLLEPIRQRNQGKGYEQEIVADTLGEIIALIKGENK